MKGSFLHLVWMKGPFIHVATRLARAPNLTAMNGAFVHLR
jgi:hypothetical protein